VLAFSEIYQVTALIRRLASFIAGHGYLVAVPEVYHEYEPPGTVLAYDTAGTDRGNLLETTKPVAAFDADARVALCWLAAHPACTGRLGTFGVCLAGISPTAQRSIAPSPPPPAATPPTSTPPRSAPGKPMTASRAWSS
jgi:dienelactone hydrolase